MLIDESFMVDLFHHHTSHYATLDLFESRKEGKKFFKTTSFGSPYFSQFRSDDVIEYRPSHLPQSLDPYAPSLLVDATSRIGKWIAYSYVPSANASV